MNRQIPNDFDKQNFLETINIIEKLFGKKWLNKNKQNHPLKQLWHRKDFLASNELYVIGLGLEKALKNSEKVWVDNFIKEIRKHKDIRQIQALCYELFIYTLFQNNIKLAKPNQQSLDLILIKNRQKINISIKRLTESDREKQLYKEFLQHKQFLEENLNALNENAIQLIIMFSEYNNYEIEKSKKLIQEALKNKQDIFNHNHMVIIKKIKCEQDGWTLSEQKKTYALNLLIKIEENEQKRFINLFKKASSNLKKIDPNENEINMIVIGLPEYISFDSAQSWITKEFNQKHYTSISGVLLTRYLPVQDLKTNTTLLNLEFRFIYNINAKYPINYKDEILKMEIPIGTISQKEAIKSFVNENGDKFELKDYYSFQEGYKLCEPLFFNQKLEYNFNYIQNFTEGIMYQNKIIAPIRPEGNKLVCL